MSKSLGSLLVDIGASTARLEKDLNRARKDFDTFGRSATNTAKNIGLSIGAGLGAASIGELMGQLKDAGIAAERMRNAMTAATGSAAQSASELAFVRAEADRLGLDLLSTSASFTKLTAAAKGTALEGQNTRDIFTAVSSASTALGLSAEEAGGALTAIQQMMSKGTVQAEELRGQLGERLPGAFNVAARAMGVTTAELGKMLEQGQVISSEFLPKFAEELKKTFPVSESMMKSAAAETNRLSTAFYDLKVSIMDIGGMDALKGGLSGLSTLIQTVNADLRIGARLLAEEKLMLQQFFDEVAIRMDSGENLNRWLTAGGRSELQAELDASRQMYEYSWDKIQERWRGVREDLSTFVGPPPPDFGKIAAAAQAAAEEQKKLAIKSREEMAAIQKDMAVDGINARVNAWATGEAIQKEMELDAITSRVDAWVAGEALIAQVRLESSQQAQEELFDAIETQKTMELNAITSRVDEWVKGEEEKKTASEKAYSEMQNAVAGWAANFSGTLADMAFGAKTTFNDILTSFGKMIAQMMIQRAVVEPLLGSMGFGTTTKSANGNIFSGGKLQAFASGGIVSKPTLFPMANGAGLMGEAGPEAIIPLKRGRDGRLGVEGGSGGTVVQVMVNNAPAKVREEHSNSGGKELVKIFIDAVDDAIGSGRMDKTFNRTFGLQRGGTR